MKKITLLSIVAFFLFINNSFCQDGSLDTTFDGDGIVTTTVGGANNYHYSLIALQLDGKIVMATNFVNASGDSDFGLLRYNTNGSLDTTFGISGLVTTDFGTIQDQPFAIAIQPDGKIIVAGSTKIAGNYDSNFAVARYNSNGSLDTTFDSDGKVITDINANSGDSAIGIAIQTDGKIIVAGTSSGSTIFDIDFAIARYNNDGSLDTTFDGDGKVTTNMGTSVNKVSSILLQPDGKIVVGGYTTVSSFNHNFALARYNSNGSLDTSFDTDGKVFTDIGIYDEQIASIALQTDGKIIAAGYTKTSASVTNFALVRYTTSGSLDTSFDTDGIVTTDFGGNNDYIRSVNIMSDGKIIAAGIRFNSVSLYDFALAKYNSDGSLDTSFDGDGKVTTDLAGNTRDNASSSLIQPDGKIVVAGSSTVDSTIYNLALVRYNNTSLGLPEINQNNTIVFPNPTSNTITIQSKNQPFQKATITNAVGQTILKKDNLNTSEINLDLSSQSSGMYFLTIENESNKTTQKIIKN